MTLTVYARVMLNWDGERKRLRALVDGWSIGQTPASSAQGGPNRAESSRIEFAVAGRTQG